MLPQHVLFALAATVAAVPLNINLGAYSPALVVGDGEISLGNTESASELMATLQTGATQNRPGQQETRPARPASTEQEPAEQKPEEQKPAEEKPGEQKPAEQTPGEQKPAEQKPGEQKPEEQKPEGEKPAKRAISEILGRRSATEAKMEAVEAAMQWIKRDLSSFNAALGYAKDAMKDTPMIEIGSENAGVGIVVNPGVNVPKGSAAAGNKAKRGEVVAEDEAPKMTLVAITEV